MALLEKGTAEVARSAKKIYHTDNNRGSNLGYNQMLDNYLNNLGYNQQLVITSWLLAAGYNQLVISFINSILISRIN